MRKREDALKPEKLERRGWSWTGTLQFRGYGVACEEEEGGGSIVRIFHRGGGAESWISTCLPWKNLYTLALPGVSLGLHFWGKKDQQIT